MNHLQGVKVGDTLLIVGRRGDAHEGRVVTKVGREYATCGEGGYGAKYRLSNGYQGYVNGFSAGGQAFLSLEHFELRQKADEAWARLTRLCHGPTPSHLWASDIQCVIDEITGKKK